jgi:hypothetical protein
MNRLDFRRITAAFVLIAVLGLPLSAVAAPRAAAERSEDRPVATASVFAGVWNLVASSLSKSTCVIDPYGRCILAKNAKLRRQSPDSHAPQHPLPVAF